MRTGSTYICEVLAHTLFDENYIYLNEREFGEPNQIVNLSQHHLVKIHHAPYHEIIQLVPTTLPILIPVRDPMDVYVSAIHFAATRQGMTFDQSLLHLTEIKWFEGMWERMKSFLHCSDPRIAIIQYEDLIQYPVNTLQQALVRLNIPFNPKRLHHWASAFSFTSKTGRQMGQESRGTHERNGSIGQWKNHPDASIRKYEEASSEYRKLLSVC
ncbi:MAG: hypothetical protein GC178_05865 [Flavobacteriales bacterium]|nr:hypothetical protein [Flavobacteriales bacterium]